ncbi:MAG: BrnA antitoxin family protein [Terracidiphilus sp.]|jgi:uncharacterized protein (DUF4415 family)
MKQRYDFSRGTRGRIVAPKPEPRGKTRITIRLDEDLVDHFLKEAEASGGATGYQTLINEALRQHVEGKAPKLEETLRRIVREEMRVAS